MYQMIFPGGTRLVSNRATAHFDPRGRACSVNRVFSPTLTLQVPILPGSTFWPRRFHKTPLPWLLTYQTSPLSSPVELIGLIKSSHGGVTIFPSWGESSNSFILGSSLLRQIGYNPPMIIANGQIPQWFEGSSHTIVFHIWPCFDFFKFAHWCFVTHTLNVILTYLLEIL